MTSGANVTPDIIGSITKSENDVSATRIDSVTGVGNDDGDVPKK